MLAALVNVRGLPSFVRPSELLMLTVLEPDVARVTVVLRLAVAPDAKLRVDTPSVAPVLADSVTVHAAESAAFGVTVTVAGLPLVPLLADMAMVKAVA